MKESPASHCGLRGMVREVMAPEKSPAPGRLSLLLYQQPGHLIQRPGNGEHFFRRDQQYWGL